jgi:uncharacterized protein YggE
MKSILSLLMLTVMSTAFAQETQPKDPFIEVTGRADLEVEPNEIYLLIRLREFEENKKKTSLEQLEKDFQAAIKSAGIEKSRVLLADAGSNLGSISKRDKDAFRSKSYQIKLTSATELEKVIEKLQSVTVDLADITSLGHSDLEKINQDLKVKALQAARAKADMLAKSIGSTIGKPLMIREWDYEYRPMDMTANVAYRMDAAQPEPTAFRKIKLQAQITAQFEIK